MFITATGSKRRQKCVVNFKTEDRLALLGLNGWEGGEEMIMGEEEISSPTKEGWISRTGKNSRSSLQTDAVRSLIVWVRVLNSIRGRKWQTSFSSHSSRLEMQMQVWLQMTLDGDHSQLPAGHPYCWYNNLNVWQKYNLSLWCTQQTNEINSSSGN